MADGFIEVPVEDVLASYIQGAPRLIPLIALYERPRLKDRAGRPKHPKRPQIEYYLYREDVALSIVQEAIKGFERSYAGRAIHVELLWNAILHGLYHGVKGEHRGEFTALRGSRSLEAALSTVARLGLRPVIAFMTLNIPHYIVVLQLLIVKMLSKKLSELMWSNKPVILILLGRGWPGEVPAQKEKLSRGLENVVGKLFSSEESEGRLIIKHIDLTRVSMQGVISLAELMASAHYVYFTSGITTPHTFLSNLVMSETGTFTGSIARGFAFLYSLAELGFPFRLHADEVEVDPAAYIYVGGMTYHALVRLYLESLLLASSSLRGVVEKTFRSLKEDPRGILERLEAIGSRYDIFARITGLPSSAEWSSFIAHVVPVKRFNYLWEAGGMILKLLAEMDDEYIASSMKLVEELYKHLNRLHSISLNAYPDSIKLDDAWRTLEYFIPLLQVATSAIIESGMLKRGQSKIAQCNLIMDALSHPFDLTVMAEAFTALLKGERDFIRMPGLGVCSKAMGRSCSEVCGQQRGRMQALFQASNCWRALYALAWCSTLAEPHHLLEAFRASRQSRS